MAKVMERLGDSLAERVYLPAISAGRKVTRRHFVRNPVGRKHTVRLASRDVNHPQAPRSRGPRREWNRLNRNSARRLRVGCNLTGSVCQTRRRLQRPLRRRGILV